MVKAYKKKQNQIDTFWTLHYAYNEEGLFFSSIRLKFQMFKLLKNNNLNDILKNVVWAY